MIDLTTINLSASSLEQLLRHKVRVEEAIVAARAADKKSAMAAVKIILAERGYTMNDLMDILPGPARVKSKASKALAKYSDPQDGSRTWSGRGRQPRWFREALAGGATIEQLEISV